MATWTDGQLIGLIMVVMGLVAFFAVLEWRRRTLRLYERAVPASAKVGTVKHRSGEAGSYYRTQLSFVDALGVDIEAKANLGRSYSRGERINIVYDPASPTRVMLASEVGTWKPDGGPLAFGMRWGLVLIFLIPGIVLILIPIGDPICDDPTFKDMAFCLTSRT